jgi:hypothetical protein
MIAPVVEDSLLQGEVVMEPLAPRKMIYLYHPFCEVMRNR